MCAASSGRSCASRKWASSPWTSTASTAPTAATSPWSVWTCVGVWCLCHTVGWLKQSLKDLARLANLLERTAVLPPFPCRREKGEAPFCNVCHFDLPNCFKDVLGRFRSPVRESVFFTNPLVPEAIKVEERNNPIYSFSRNCKASARYETSFPPRANHSNSVICVPCHNSLFQCVREYGKTVNSSVFRIFSLFSVCCKTLCEELQIEFATQIKAP